MEASEDQQPRRNWQRDKVHNNEKVSEKKIWLSTGSPELSFFSIQNHNLVSKQKLNKRIKKKS